MDKRLKQASELNKLVLKMSQDISRIKMMTMNNYAKAFRLEKLVSKHH